VGNGGGTDHASGHSGAGQSVDRWRTAVRVSACVDGWLSSGGQACSDSTPLPELIASATSQPTYVRHLRLQLSGRLEATRSLHSAKLQWTSEASR